MFDSIGWGEVLILIVAGLFILGPERLPTAAAWLGKTVRQVREYATGARDQLRSELGPEFDEIRKPLQDLRNARNFDPKQAVTKHLFDGDNPMDGMGDEVFGNGHKPTADSPRRTGGDRTPLEPGERPPFDSDAT